MVREAGVEPARGKPPLDFESSLFAIPSTPAEEVPREGFEPPRPITDSGF